MADLVLVSQHMGALTAFVELVKALAWPATLLSIILLLRKVIEALIASIHEGRLKYGDLELILKRDLQQARDSIKGLPTPALTLHTPQESEISDLMSLAQLAPRAATIEAWARLEVAGAEFVQKHATTVALACHVWRSTAATGT